MTMTKITLDLTETELRLLDGASEELPLLPYGALIQKFQDALDEVRDSTPWCIGCGAVWQAQCHCGPLVGNE